MFDKRYRYVFPNHLIPEGSRIIIYGAADTGRDYAQYVSETNYCTILAIADKSYRSILPFYQCHIISPEDIVSYDFDYILIASLNYHKEIRKYLLSINIPDEKLKYAEIRKFELTGAPIAPLYMDYFLAKRQKRLANPIYTIHPIHKILINSLQEYCNADLFDLVPATKQLFEDFKACNQYAITGGFDNERYYYGALSCLLDYSELSYNDYDMSLCPEIQHGMFWHSMPFSYGHSPIVLGDCYQNKYHSSFGIEIGPMIKYAASLYTESELDTIKQRVGKTLVAFPAHSTTNFSISYDEMQFISWLREYGKSYDTVLVCLSFNDLNANISSLCAESGIKIITAGVRPDQNFLSRLNSILLLADTVIINEVGGALHHSVAMDKEVVWYKSEIKHAGDFIIDTSKSTDYIIPELEEQKSVLLKELKSAEPLSDTAKNCVKDLFRHAFFRSPIEIKSIFEINKTIYNRAYGDKTLFRECTLAYLNELSSGKGDQDALKYKLLHEAIQEKERLQSCKILTD